MSRYDEFKSELDRFAAEATDLSDRRNSLINAIEATFAQLVDFKFSVSQEDETYNYLYDIASKLGAEVDGELPDIEFWMPSTC